MTLSLRRVAGICGLSSVALLVANLVFTVDGPRPLGDASLETARIVANSDAIRTSALLGVLQTLALTGFVVALALVVRARRPYAFGGAAVAAVVYCSLALTSMAALAASAQAADTGLGTAAVMGIGHLHSTTLLIAFVPLGIALLSLAASGLFGRVATWSAVMIGACGVLATFALLDTKLDQGGLGMPVAIAFLGSQIWTAVVSAGLLRRRSRAEGLVPLHAGPS